MERLIHTCEGGQAEDLIPQFVRDEPRNHAAEGIADYCEWPIPEMVEDVSQGTVRDLVRASGMTANASFSPWQVNVDALPRRVDELLQREHDPMVDTESMDRHKRKSMARNSSYHDLEPTNPR